VGGGGSAHANMMQILISLALLKLKLRGLVTLDRDAVGDYLGDCSEPDIGNI
jgi:hypothetical protein